MLVHRRSLPRNFVRFPQQFAGTHLYSWVERGTVRVKCLAQEHNTVSPARARTRTARSGDERTNHEATAPPIKDRKGNWASRGVGVWTPLCQLKFFFSLMLLFLSEQVSFSLSVLSFIVLHNFSFASKEWKISAVSNPQPAVFGHFFSAKLCVTLCNLCVVHCWYSNVFFLIYANETQNIMK